MGMKPADACRYAGHSWHHVNQLDTRWCSRCQITEGPVFIHDEILEEVAKMAEEIDGIVDGIPGEGPILPLSFTDFAESVRALKGRKS